MTDVFILKNFYKKDDGDKDVRVDGRILQAIEQRQETTPMDRDDVTQNRELQTRA
jgi:hypothetical protein